MESTAMAAAIPRPFPKRHNVNDGRAEYACVHQDSEIPDQQQAMVCEDRWCWQRNIAWVETVNSSSDTGDATCDIGSLL